MSTTTTITATTTPAPSKLQTILSIIQAALSGLSVAGLPTALEAVFVDILQSALAAYQAESGQPLNVLNIPIETPLP